MREEFEQRAVDLENKYDRKMSALRDELELRRKTEIHEVEEVREQSETNRDLYLSKLFSSVRMDRSIS